MTDTRANVSQKSSVIAVGDAIKAQDVSSVNKPLSYNNASAETRRCPQRPMMDTQSSHVVGPATDARPTITSDETTVREGIHSQNRPPRPHDPGPSSFIKLFDVVKRRRVRR